MQSLPSSPHIVNIFCCNACVMAVMAYAYLLGIILWFQKYHNNFVEADYIS